MIYNNISCKGIWKAKPTCFGGALTAPWLASRGDLHCPLRRRNEISDVPVDDEVDIGSTGISWGFFYSIMESNASEALVFPGDIGWNGHLTEQIQNVVCLTLEEANEQVQL